MKEMVDIPCKYLEMYKEAMITIIIISSVG